jgi:hypothetical protein
LADDLIRRMLDILDLTECQSIQEVLEKTECDAVALENMASVVMAPCEDPCPF